MRRLIGIRFGMRAALAVAAVALLAACSSGGGGGGGNALLSANKLAEVVIETDQGDIRFDLLQNEAPNTVNAIGNLILNGSYDGKTFFQRQDGAFLQFGEADPEASLLANPVDQEITGEPMDRGMVAIGWVGDRGRTSQRLIFPLSRLDERLDSQFTVFGRITSGMDVLDQMQAGGQILRISTRLNQPLIRIITQKGSIIIQMDPVRAPQTVERISDLVCQGFYNGLTFHRVEPTLIQGGDPNGDGSGGTGVLLPAEFNDGRFLRGSVGMARQPDNIDSADSQFFVMKEQVRELDGKYTYFGEVVGGMDVVDQIEIGDVMNTVALQFDLQGRDCSASQSDAPPPDDAGPGATPPDGSGNTGNTGTDSTPPAGTT
jgi:peptidylprolyl isomerase